MAQLWLLFALLLHTPSSGVVATERFFLRRGSASVRRAWVYLPFSRQSEGVNGKTFTLNLGPIGWSSRRRSTVRKARHAACFVGGAFVRARSSLHPEVCAYGGGGGRVSAFSRVRRACSVGYRISVGSRISAGRRGASSAESVLSR